MKSVSDTGPLVHLHELKTVESLAVFEKTFIPLEVATELREVSRFKKFIELKELTAEYKDKANLYVERFVLSLGESQALALAKQLEIQTFLTDDLEARETAKKLSLVPVGTIGVIIASYKKKIITKKQCVELIRKTKIESTLYITSYLIEKIIERIEKEN